MYFNYIIAAFLQQREFGLNMCVCIANRAFYAKCVIALGIQHYTRMLFNHDTIIAVKANNKLESLFIFSRNVNSLNKIKYLNTCWYNNHNKQNADGLLCCNTSVHKYSI